MTPFFFGAEPRRLYGFYLPAQGARMQDRAVVLCYPWGHEYIFAHRSMSALGRSLAAQGWHVLRFDYFGMGDSAGDVEEADLAGMRRDVDLAIEEAIDMSGAESVSLIGLRLGGAIAAMAADANPETVDSLVLWDPVVTGAEYHQQLLDSQANAVHLPTPSEPARAQDGQEILGFPLTRRMSEQILEIDTPSIVRRLPQQRLLALATRPLASHAELDAALQARPRPTSLEVFNDHAAWQEEWPVNAAVIPIQVVNRIAEWMT